jgi:hypothetical protein
MSCPYLMSDGRHFTDYLSSKYSNKNISKKNNIPQNSYNNFLQHNGLQYQKDLLELNSYKCKNNFGNCYTNANIQTCNFDICNSMLELE